MHKKIICMVIFILIIFGTTILINSNVKINIENEISGVQEMLVEKNKTYENKESLAEEETSRNLDWKIEIPAINLTAQIAEGTSKEILNKYVGHFEETAKEEGNIGLAAHNRGYDVNFFRDLKKIQEGDKIIYKYYNFEKTYIVTKNRIIKDTDWTYLENTEENIITLITCVENEPQFRRCVQAIQEEEETY